ncbi:MAG: hypothetical protein NVS9B5_36890 [Terriglobales bacterium]
MYYIGWMFTRRRSATYMDVGKQELSERVRYLTTLQMGYRQQFKDRLLGRDSSGECDLSA